ncbi:MAG: DUF4212 domain-containing protein [Phycisphaeraceae bacterium]
MTDRAPDPSAPSSPAEADAVANALRRYWRSNVIIMSVLLTIWAIVGLGCGILFADVLNRFKLGGYPLGFWFAQQGSIMVFVLLILTYYVLLNRLDKRHQADLDAIDRSSGGGPSTGGGR